MAERLTESICNTCGLTFASRNLLFIHLRTTHDVEPAPQDSCAKVVLVIGYIGSAYHGLQRADLTNDIPTVEGRLWQAVGKACGEDGNAWLERLQSDHFPPGYSRAARTDKGVHALASVVSLTLPAIRDSEVRGWLCRVNAALPDDIRVLSRARVVNDFHAKRLCDRRRYEYLVPYFALRRPDCSEAGAANALGPALAGSQAISGEAALQLRMRLKRILKLFAGLTHDYSAFTSRSGGQDTHRHMFRLHTIEPRLTRDALESARAGDSRTSTSCSDRTKTDTDEPDVWDDDFLCISVCGQSFLYNQIRRMIGAVIAVMRGSLPEGWIEAALGRSPREDTGARAGNGTEAAPHEERTTVGVGEAPQSSPHHETGEVEAGEAASDSGCHMSGLAVEALAPTESAPTAPAFALYLAQCSYGPYQCRATAEQRVPFGDYEVPRRAKGTDARDEAEDARRLRPHLINPSCMHDGAEGLEAADDCRAADVQSTPHDTIHPSGEGCEYERLRSCVQAHVMKMEGEQGIWREWISLLDRRRAHPARSMPAISSQV